MLISELQRKGTFYGSSTFFFHRTYTSHDSIHLCTSASWSLSLTSKWTTRKHRPVHVGVNPIGKVHGPSGSTSQQPTAYNNGRHPTPTNSARTELPQHLNPTTGIGVPLQLGQGKQGKLTLQQLCDLAACSQTHKFSSTNYVNAITELFISRPFLYPLSSICSRKQ